MQEERVLPPVTYSPLVTTGDLPRKVTDHSYRSHCVTSSFPEDIIILLNVIFA